MLSYDFEGVHSYLLLGDCELGLDGIDVYRPALVGPIRGFDLMREICHTHACSESHNDSINRRWDEIERAMAATDRSCGQCSCTETKDTRILRAAFPRVSLTAHGLSFCVRGGRNQDVLKQFLPDESSKLIHTSHGHV